MTTHDMSMSLGQAQMCGQGLTHARGLMCSDRHLSALADEHRFVMDRIDDAIRDLADLRVERARLRAVADAAERVSAQWESMHHCYQSTAESAVLADLLDALVSRMKEAQRT